MSTKIKPYLFSGIKATGPLHLGNYLGAVKNWVALQNSDDYQPIISVVDLHTITIAINPQELKQNIFNMTVDLLATGIDPKKSIFFVQSAVKEHAELTWIFNCITPVTELERMTQYKDKAAQHKNNINAGLFDYPVLMAADILLYKALVVPVGEDQEQHVELARVVARKFNQRWGAYFPEPKSLFTQTPRLMSLTEPAKKMSKDSGAKSYIALSDSPDEIVKKIKSATTDAGGGAQAGNGGKNLLDLLVQFCGDEKIVKKFQQDYEKGVLKYSELKPALAEAIIEVLKPWQTQRQKLFQDKKYVTEVLEQGAQQARTIAAINMLEIKQRIGLV
ncbi:MAG TPA: tryptophan--tRNA ligase [bacterium]|nr:tryptophan--tRNA ligase [bacterium]